MGTIGVGTLCSVVLRCCSIAGFNRVFGSRRCPARWTVQGYQVVFWYFGRHRSGEVAVVYPVRLACWWSRRGSGLAVVALTDRPGAWTQRAAGCLGNDVCGPPRALSGPLRAWPALRLVLFELGRPLLRLRPLPFELRRQASQPGPSGRRRWWWSSQRRFWPAGRP